MSSTAPLRSRLPRMAPQLAHAAVQRARLTVVPRTRRRNQAPRVPFVTLVSAVLLAGVVGLLLFNTSMQQASFRATALQRQASDLSAREEALEMQLQELRDPTRVARRAQEMGLVVPTTPAFLDLATGKVIGVPAPAGPDQQVPLFAPGAGRPAELDPPTVTVRERTPDRDRDRRRDPDGRETDRNRDSPRDRDRDGAPDRDRDHRRNRLGAERRDR